MGHSRSGAFSFNPQKIILSPPCAFITSFNGRCPNESEATSSSFCSPLSSLCNRRLSPTSDCSSTLPPRHPIATTSVTIKTTTLKCATVGVIVNPSLPYITDRFSHHSLVKHGSPPITIPIITIPNEQQNSPTTA